MKPWVAFLKRFTRCFERKTFHITASKKISLLLLLPSKQTYQFLLPPKLDFQGRIAWTTILRQIWYLFGEKYFNFTTESYKMSIKILFFKVDLLLNWLTLSTKFLCSSSTWMFVIQKFWCHSLRKKGKSWTECMNVTKSKQKRQ